MSEKIMVLVVEDEPHIRKVLEYNLKLDGFGVYLAEDGAVGLSMAREKHPDVILLDWLMPQISGLNVLAVLKNNNDTKHIPVFMLTAKGMLSDVTEALEKGADDRYFHHRLIEVRKRERQWRIKPLKTRFFK